jgi:hypothetical protein
VHISPWGSHLAASVSQLGWIKGQVELNRDDSSYMQACNV